MSIKEQIKNTKKKIIEKTKRKARKVIDKSKPFILAGAMAVSPATEAEAQTYRTSDGTPVTHEVVMDSNGKMQMRPIAQNNQTRTTNGQFRQVPVPQTQSQTTQRSQTARRQQAQQGIVGPEYNGVQLQYSSAYSYGLRRGYVGAFINPYENPNRPTEAHIYYCKRGLDGRPVIVDEVTKDYADAGFGPYAIPFEARRATLLGGYYGWGVPGNGGVVQGAHEVLGVISHGAAVADQIIRVTSGHGRHRR